MNGIVMDQAWLKFVPARIRTKLEKRYTLQNILSNTGWLLIDRILRMGVGLFVGAWTARYLGPVQFGIYNYAIAFVALFIPLATLGLEKIVIRNVLQNPSIKGEILGTTFVLKAASGLLILGTASVLILFVRPQDRVVQTLVVITSFTTCFFAFETIDYWFQSQVQSKYIVYARNFGFLAASSAKVILILAHAPLIAFAWAGLIEIAVGAAGMVVFYRISRQHIRAWRFSARYARELLSDSWPLILSGLSVVTYMKIDQIMLGEMVGNEAVGIYSAVTKLSEIWYFIPVIIVSSVFPSVIKTKSADKHVYYARLQKLFSFMTALAFSISIMVTLLSPFLVSLIFGQSFAQGGAILAIHIWATFFVFLGTAQTPWDVAENLTKISLFRTVSAAIINIVLNLFLIPVYQAKGAAIATVISYSCSSYILNAFHPKTWGIFIRQTKSFFFVPTLLSLLRKNG